MVVHVVVFKWLTSRAADDVGRLGKALTELGERMPEIRSLIAGPDLGVRPGTWDFAVVAQFATVDDYRRYATDPAHLRIISELIEPHLEARQSVQIEAASEACEAGHAVASESRR